MSANNSFRPPRVAFVAGTLGVGGAEKQLVYMVRSLQQRGVEVRVYSLLGDGPHCQALARLGAPVICLTRSRRRMARLVSLIGHLRGFSPDIVQSAHFFMNFYVGLAGRWLGIASIGALRNDGASEVADCGSLGRLGLDLPHGLIANSRSALAWLNARGRRSKPSTIIANVIDLEAFDTAAAQEVQPLAAPPRPLFFAVGRLVPQKRFDLFVAALALARRQMADLTGVIVGAGPEEARLRSYSAAAGMRTENLMFLGARSDVPALLRQGTGLVLTSSHEGFPNVVLEAMAAGIPVITTPAGDAAAVVEDGQTGHVVPHDAVELIAHRMIELAQDPARAQRMGRAGRGRAVHLFTPQTLADSLFSFYRTVVQPAERRPLFELMARPAV
jgi:glycosyltransferase involved in cell wall biosynthesis